MAQGCPATGTGTRSCRRSDYDVSLRRAGAPGPRRSRAASPAAPPRCPRRSRAALRDPRALRPRRSRAGGLGAWCAHPWRNRPCSCRQACAALPLWTRRSPPYGLGLRASRTARFVYRLCRMDVAGHPELPHPVAELLRERLESGSTPGERQDPHRLALVLEGGGMRGVVSAGMTAALERLGLTGCFDLVVGSSAGAINGAALLAGVACEGAATYCGPLASRSFVNPARVLVGRPVIDVNYILNYASSGLDAGRHDRVLSSPIALHCVAVNIETARPVDLCGMRTKQELWDALLASSRMPWAGGAPVEIDGCRYVDGGLGSAIPVDEALAAGATHVLALQT